MLSMNKTMNKGQKIFYIVAVFVLPLLLLIAESSITINQVELALNYFTLPMLCHWLVGCACALYAGLLLHSGYKYRDKAVGLCALLSALLLLLCNIFSYAEGANVALHSLPFSIQVSCPLNLP